jgi:hypothetical protein
VTSFSIPHSILDWWENYFGSLTTENDPPDKSKRLNMPLYGGIVNSKTRIQRSWNFCWEIKFSGTISFPPNIYKQDSIVRDQLRKNYDRTGKSQ